MKQPLYILQSGTLKRRQNTLMMLSKDGSQKRIIPIEQVQEIHVFGEVDFNTKLLRFLDSKEVVLHVYNYYGGYSGSFIPRQRNISGLVVVQQCAWYLDNTKRLTLAKAFVKGSVFNMLKNVRYYEHRGRGLKSVREGLEGVLEELDGVGEIASLRGLEGKARDLYYDGWQEILTVGEPFVLKKRQRRPPSNPINALISFGNGLLYATIVSECYAVHLHGGISFVHEPGRYRFSLALDLADIFKPVLVDRLIFNLVNHRKLQEKHFDRRLSWAYLNDSGRRIFIQAWQERLNTTVKHPTLRRKVSYRQLIRLECYKLVKHFLGDKPYEPFRMWW